MSPGALLLPLGAGFGYALGVLRVRGAIGKGVSGARVNLVCNAVMALFFQILWLLPRGASCGFREMMMPMLCGLLFFLGQIFTFRAIAAGDVSVSTPVLGTKVVFVALFSALLLGIRLPFSWWCASLLASLGIAFISYMPAGGHRGIVASVSWSLAAAAVFALTDVMVQSWVPSVGYTRFAPIMFGTMGLCSLIHLPQALRERGISPAHEGRPSTAAAIILLLPGALLLAMQALAMYSAIGLYGNATQTNILYGTRCLWSVLLAWFLSGSGEDSSSVMARRFVGALLLFGAMALVLS